MRCIAHRGFALAYPENTVPAVEQAVSDGADGIEVDVRQCASGELVVVHDETVDRVSDGTGRVGELSLATLRSLDVLDTGRGIPTLAAVVDSLPTDVSLVAELKETGLAGDAADVLAPVDRVLISSFDATALAEVAQSTTLPYALLCRGDDDAVATATDLGCRAIHPHQRHCDQSLVTAAHDAGIAVTPWTVRSQSTAERLAAVGADGLIADAPAYCPC